MKSKNVLEMRLEFPSGTEKELCESLSELLSNIELALKTSLAQKLIEEKGLSKKIGGEIAKEVRKGAAKRLEV